MKAPDDLRDIVEGIWIQQDDEVLDRAPEGRVIPTGTVEILFNYGDPIYHFEPGRTAAMPAYYVTGQRTRPVMPFVNGRVGILLVSLYPWGLGKLIPGVSGEQDIYADLVDLVPRGIYSRLVDSFAAANDSRSRIEAACAFLRELRRDEAAASRPVRAAVRSMLAPGPASQVAELADEIGVSRRHLTRSFHREIGVPTKRFGRIMRFQQAITLRQDEGLGWAEVALRCGYSDQAHLCHELRELSGRAPGDIAARKSRASDIFNGGRASRIFHTVYL